MAGQQSSHHETRPRTPLSEVPSDHSTSGHGHDHGWLMWLMCLPMLILVLALLAAGRVGAVGLLYAVGCLAMMGAMMLWMNHGNSGDHRS